MTKVQIELRLARPLDEALMAKIAAAHSIYGIHRIKVTGESQSLVVEYDATRFRAHEVQAALASAGIPVASTQKPATGM